LSAFPNSEYRETLLKFCAFAVDRDRWSSRDRCFVVACRSHRRGV